MENRYGLGEKVMLREERIFQIYTETLFDLHDMKEKGEVMLDKLEPMYINEDTDTEAFEKMRDENPDVLLQSMMNKMIMAVLCYGRVLELPHTMILGHLEASLNAEGLKEALDQQIQAVYTDSTDTIH